MHALLYMITHLFILLIHHSRKHPQIQDSTIFLNEKKKPTQILVIPVECGFVVLEHTSYVPSGTTQAFINISCGSALTGFQSSRDVSKSSATRTQKPNER